jgi:hypothetical protein
MSGIVPFSIGTVRVPWAAQTVFRPVDFGLSAYVFEGGGAAAA